MQLVAYLVWDQVVEGSSPFAYTRKLIHKYTTMEIERVNAYGIDFPSYVRYFITEIQDSIIENNLKEEESLEIKFDSEELKYCYQGFELIKKTFLKKGFLVPLPTFKRDESFHYTFNVIKLSESIDDLPF